MLTWSLDPCQTMLRTSLERAKHQGVFFQICWQELPQNIRKNCETITGEALSATLQSKKKMWIQRRTFSCGMFQTKHLHDESLNVLQSNVANS